MRSLRSLLVIAAVLQAAPHATAAVYTENVGFTLRSDQVSYSGTINDAYLMIDRTGGRNPVPRAKKMTCVTEGSARVCNITLTLEEGEWIYIFLVNPEPSVDMDDPNLNPDDIPDNNFLRFPKDCPRGGQYGTDCLKVVRDPNRPEFDAATVQPGYGALITGNQVDFSVQVKVGLDNKALAGVDSAYPPRVEVQMGPPKGVQYAPGFPTEPSWQDLPNVTFNFNAGTGRGTLGLRWDNPTEGFHLVRFHAFNVDGVDAKPLVASVLVNRDNQPPVMHPGPMRFGAVGQEIVINAGMAEDPDLVGFTDFGRRVVSGPGGVTWRDVDEERRSGNILDSHFNWNGDAYSGHSAVPRFKASSPGDYVVGMTATDNGGLTSPEVEHKVHVVSSFNADIKVRLEGYVDGNDVVIDASLSTGTGATSLAIYPDPRNPASVSPTVNGMVARFPKPSTPGFYLFHGQVGGNSYHRTIMMNLKEDGSAYLQDYGSPPPAWRGNRVMYVGYVREFYDSNADGEGDYVGMLQKLAHLWTLGVNAVWLLPLTEGPTTHGYAASAQFDSEGDYGSMEQFDDLIEAAHALGLEVLMDLVANHTSDQHIYFKQARQNPNTPLRDHYLFNADGSYIYWADAIALPNVNTNNPLERRNIVDMVRYWMEHGIDGIRADVAADTPPSVWEDVRHLVKSINPQGVMLAEINPPIAEYFDQRFDMAYHKNLYEHGLINVFANGANPPSATDWHLEDSEKFFANSGNPRIRDSLRPRDLLWMRFLDNQDEERFLRMAGGKKERLKVAASVLLTLPGVPLIAWGDELGLQEMRGRMPFPALETNTEVQQLFAHYRNLINIRMHNWALRVPDDNVEGQAGNSYLRISADWDEGGQDVFGYMRHGGSQRFILLACKTESSLPLYHKVFPPSGLLTNFPDGNLKLVNHLKATDVQTKTKAELLAGIRLSVPGLGAKIYQITRNGIPDADADGVLDSYDRCLGTANTDQNDADGDDVGDPCDQCPNTPTGTAVNTVGCSPVDCADGKRNYVLDGEVDDPGYQVAEDNGHKLYASFNGQTLYVATEAAARGEDVFIVVTEDGAAAQAAPFGKSGQVAFTGIALADEGDNDYAEWLGATGQALAFTEAVPGRKMLEGTINILEEYGRVPQRMRVVALRYGGQAAGRVQAQVPAPSSLDDTVNTNEMFDLAMTVSAHAVDCTGGTSSSSNPQTSSSGGAVTSTSGNPVTSTSTATSFQTTSSTSTEVTTSSTGTATTGTTSTTTTTSTSTDSSTSQATSGSASTTSTSSTVVDGGVHEDAGTPDGNGDWDRDGIIDGLDNCPRVSNRDQDDYDGDKVGNVCDQCPASRSGAVVDADGCEQGVVTSSSQGGSDDDDDDDGSICACAHSQQDSLPGGLLMALAVLVLVKRRRPDAR